MSVARNGTTKNLIDSRKQALQALISSLGPNGSEERKLSEEQVNALSDRLNQILGNVDEGPEIRRNEKGELLNEEDLPIIDISEPMDDASGPSQSSEAFLSEHDPPQLSSLSEEERLQRRIRRDRILDMLEEEERREHEKELERERVRSVEEVAKMDAESKAAAREMQKKMGKALLKNLAAQRDKEEEERKVQEAAAKASSQNGDTGYKRPRKSVSFANVPEIDEAKPKPKPPVVWGDVSVAKLKAGVPKPKLKAEVLKNQPMKMEVVERIPGEERQPLQERDSDDESNPSLQDLEPIDRAEHESIPSLDCDYENSDMSTRESEEDEDEEFDFSQASMQREVALEYIRLRESVGAEEDEWNQPKVPLDASLASKPSKSGVSRFKAARQANSDTASNASMSLGTSILPKDKSSALQKSVHTGKLENGQLVGGNAGESDSEADENENVTRMMEMLKNGIVVGEVVPSARATSAEAGLDTVKGIERDVLNASTSSETRPPQATSRKHSRFLSERTPQRSSTESAPGPDAQAAATSLPVLNTVTERPASNGPVQSVSIRSGRTMKQQPLANPAFKKPPTVIPAPSTPSQLRPFARPQIPPDPAVLSNVIVESPSFPPPNAKILTQPGSRPLPLVSEVRESTRRANTPEESTQRTGKVSRFKAER